MNRRARRWKAAYQDIAEIREQTERQREQLRLANIDAVSNEAEANEFVPRAYAAEAKLAAIREWCAPRARLNADYDDILAILDGAR